MDFAILWVLFSNLNLNEISSAFAWGKTLPRLVLSLIWQAYFRIFRGNIIWILSNLDPARFVNISLTRCHQISGQCPLRQTHVLWIISVQYCEKQWIILNTAAPLIKARALWLIARWRNAAKVNKNKFVQMKQDDQLNRMMVFPFCSFYA